MDNTLKIAYAEVDQILSILGQKYKQEIPIKIQKLFKEHKDNEHRIILNKDTKIEDIHLSRKALIILSILNLKYWEKNPENIEKLKQQYHNNEIQYQEKINQYKNKYWLQKTNQKINFNIQENTEVTSLIEQKNISIICKIKRFLINLIHRRK